MKTYHSGIDYFASDIDKPPRTDIKCLACGAALKAEKTNGPRSWAGAMAGMKSEHYSYHCPNTELELHSNIVELMVEQEDITSKKLRAIVESEIEENRALLRAKKGNQG